MERIQAPLHNNNSFQCDVFNDGFNEEIIFEHKEKMFDTTTAVNCNNGSIEKQFSILCVRT